MKQFLNILFVVFITGTTLHAQQGQSMERIHAAKMAYIADRLHLSAEESGNFIPVYNQYEKEVRTERQAFRKKYKDVKPDNADDATTLQWIDDNLDYQQRVIEIKRKYNDRFLKVLSPQQLADLYKAEREFRQILMQRLQHRREGGRRMMR